MKILLAGPGTGKTYKVKQILRGYSDLESVLVLSFTNATIQDLLSSFAEDGISVDERRCLTLHKYGLKLNHEKELHILNNVESDILHKYSDFFEVSFLELCRMLNCITYDQIILDLVAFAKANPAYLKEKIGELKLLIVDEYQDFNPAEQELIEIISQHSEETLILGDDDQCIYDFKDATSEKIIEIHNDPKIENLEHENRCYRCPDNVVIKCTNLLSKNINRVNKDWITNNKAGDVIFDQQLTARESSNWIYSKIEEIKNTNTNDSIMILTPVQFAIENLCELLNEKKVEFNNFFNEKLSIEIQIMIWKLRLIFGSNKLLNFIFLFEFSNPTQYKKKKFKEMLKKEIRKDFSFDVLYPNLKEFIENEVLDEIEATPNFDDFITQEPWQIFQDVINGMRDRTLNTKLEKIELHMQEPTQFQENGINIMTIHKSKGLQADHVFILGLVDGIIPNQTRGLDSMEMQRRLLFVGMSRAKKNLYLCSTVKWEGKYINKVDKSKFEYDYRSKLWNGKTSPFIDELSL